MTETLFPMHTYPTLAGLMERRAVGVGIGFTSVVLAGWVLAMGMFGNALWVVAGGISLAVAGCGLFGMSVRGWVPAADES